MLDAEGLHVDAPTAITTVGGRKVDLYEFGPRDVDVETIAHSLSLLCRYNGHSKGHLSVARHSIWVASKLPPRLKLAGLFHDSAEAYVGDIIRPLKHTGTMTEYLDLESSILRVIATEVGFRYPLDRAVKAADTQVLVEIELPEPDGARYTWDSGWRDDKQEFMDLYKELR